MRNSIYKMPKSPIMSKVIANPSEGKVMLYINGKPISKFPRYINLIFDLQFDPFEVKENELTDTFDIKIT